MLVHLRQVHPLQMLFLKTNFYVGALETSAPPNMLITKLNYI